MFIAKQVGPGVAVAFCLASFSAGCAAKLERRAHAPANPSPPAAVARVLFDVDLTRGDAGPGVVTGGAWDNGWRCTGTPKERILFDAGQPISNGMLEVSFTANALPWEHQRGKINFVGLYEEPSLNQDATQGDLFYARSGQAGFRFLNIKAAGRPFDRTEFEPRVGSTNDWICDDVTVMTIRFEWRDGVPVFYDSKGRATVFPRDIVGGDTPVDQLRYVFIGSDNYTGLTIKGLRFTRVKLVDLGPEAVAPPPERLRVSDNGRRLVNESGRVVFLLADTAWGMVNRLKREDISTYLQQRRAQRFNAVTFTLTYPGNPKNAYDQVAFAGAGNRLDPTRPLTTPGNDPADPAQYDYWDHVDYAVSEARRLGLYIIILPAWGTAVVGDANTGELKPETPLNETNAWVYGRWLATRYQDEPHVLWMVGGDCSAEFKETGRDYRPVFRALAAGLREGSPPALISYHSAKRRLQSGDWFHQDDWLSFNSIQHWPEDQMPVISRDWKAQPPKPTWIFEGRYEAYWKFGHNPDDWGEWQMRQQAWQTVFAGAFGYTYGHERVFGFGKDGTDWKAHLDSPGARSMTHLARFMNAVHHNVAVQRVPDQSLVDGEPGTAGQMTSDYIAASRLPTSHFAMFYSASGRPIRVKVEALAPGPMFGTWYNPATGRWHADGRESARMVPFANNIATGPGTGVREFTPPGKTGEGHDWVLTLCKNPAYY